MERYLIFSAIYTVVIVIVSNEAAKISHDARYQLYLRKHSPSSNSNEIREKSTLPAYSRRDQRITERLKPRSRVRINKAWNWKKKYMTKRKRIKNKERKTNKRVYLNKYNPRRHHSRVKSRKSSKGTIMKKTRKGISKSDTTSGQEKHNRKNKVIIRVPRMFVTDKKSPLDLNDVKMAVVTGTEEEGGLKPSHFFTSVKDLIENKNSKNNPTRSAIDALKKQRKLRKLRNFAKSTDKYNVELINIY